MSVVVTTGPICGEAIDLLTPRATVRTAPDARAETLLRECADADVVIVRDRLPAELFDQAPHLVAAIRHGTGLDLIPVDRASAAGVLVANTPGLNAQSVAEYALLSMLLLARRVMATDHDFKGTGWSAGRSHAGSAFELGGLTLGLVGTGAVGRAVAAAVAGLGMRVLGTNTSPSKTPPGIEYAPLPEMVAVADVVVVCCPLNDETHGLLDAAHLRRLRDGALLVHVGREDVVDLSALADELRTGRLGGAALDLTQDSTAISRDLGHLPNVLLTPHVAGVTGSSMRRMGLAAARAARDVLDGHAPENTVNLASAHRFAQSARP